MSCIGCQLTTFRFNELPSSLIEIDLTLNQISTIDITRVPPNLRILNLRYQKVNETTTLQQRLRRANFIQPLPNDLHVKLERNGPIDLDYGGGLVESWTFDLWGDIVQETVRWDDGAEIIIDRDCLCPDPLLHDSTAVYDLRSLNDSSSQMQRSRSDTHLGVPGILAIWIVFLIAIVIMICSWKLRDWCRNWVFTTDVAL